VVVNVLPRPAFLEARIAGSINLPLAEIPDRAREILPDLSAEIIAYCGSFT
jgi:rhodanese-related sulfurtransferase